MINKQIFINCPFDEEYRKLLRPLLFTIIYHGFSPRIASETFNSAQNRIEKICDLIKSSRYSIHDLSRCKSSRRNEFFRMNMPFEFGIDYCYFIFNNPDKKILFLEKNYHDYHKSISDLSGVDTKWHNNEPEDIVRCIRDWIIEANILKSTDSPTVVWYRFADFASDFYDERRAAGFSKKDLNDMPTPEYIRSIKTWVKKNNSK